MTGPTTCGLWIARDYFRGDTEVSLGLGRCVVVESRVLSDPGLDCAEDEGP